MKSLFTTLILMLFVSASAFARTGVTEIIELESVFNEVSEKETLTDNRRPLAIIRRFNPDVFVKTNGKSEWANATVTQPLFNADSLVTNDSGFAMIQFMDNSIVRMRPNSLLIVGGESRTRESTVTRLTMGAGEIFVSVTGLGESTEVVTPSAVAAVRGTNFAVLLRGDNSDCKDRDDSTYLEGSKSTQNNDGTVDDLVYESLHRVKRQAEKDTTDLSTSTVEFAYESIHRVKRLPENDGDNAFIEDFLCSDDDGNTIVIGFDGAVEVTPSNGQGSFNISGGNVILVNKNGDVFEYNLTNEELQELLNMYTAEDTSEESTRTRTLELQFVNENGEIETITIEYEEPIDNE